MREKIGVYGLGRFGYLWASMLSEKLSVIAYSRSKQRKTPPGVQRVSEEGLLKQPTIFLCVSISAMEQVVKSIGPHLKPGTLVMDTCSVKVYPAKIMGKYLPPQVEILATHPMFGPDSAKYGFNGLPIILTPVRIKADKLKKWKQFFASLKLNVIIMDADKHDHEAAYTQGITHYIGRVLADLKMEQSPIATLGYKKLLDIMEQTCNDPWQLFLDIQRYNPYTEEMRKKLHKSLERIMKTLAGSIDNL